MSTRYIGGSNPKLQGKHTCSNLIRIQVLPLDKHSLRVGLGPKRRGISNLIISRGVAQEGTSILHSLWRHHLPSQQLASSQE